MLEYIERVSRQQQDVPVENQDDSPQEYELQQTDLDVDSEYEHSEDNMLQFLQFESDSNRLDSDEVGEDIHNEYWTQSEEDPVFRVVYQQNLYTSKVSLSRESLDEGIMEDEPFVAEEQEIGPLLSQICGHERFKRRKKKPPKQLSDFGRSKKNLDIKKLGEFLLGQMKCMYYNGKLFYYKLPCWRPIDLHQFEVESRIVFEEYENTQYLRSREVRALYEYICTKPKIQYTEYIYRPTTLLNFQDGTLDLITGKFQEHRSKDLLFTALDMHYHELTYATGDVFERYVEVAGKGNELIRQQILEMIAIALTGLQVKSFYVILGPSGTGKSQLGRLVESLVGEDKVLSLRSLDECGDRFALANLQEKSLILCMDLPDAPISRPAIGMIKQLTSGADRLKTEAKYADPTVVREVPLLIAAGNFPIKLQSNQEDQALDNRMVVIPLMGVPEEEDIVPDLYNELIMEKAYIVRCAIEAYRTLIANRQTVTRVEVPAIYQTRGATDNKAMEGLMEFVEDSCVNQVGSNVSSEELHQFYQRYCSYYDLEMMSATKFRRSIKQALLKNGVEAIYHDRAIEGKRGYKNIALLSLEDISEINEN